MKVRCSKSQKLLYRK